MKTVMLAFILSLGMIGCAQNGETENTEVESNKQARVSQEEFKKFIVEHPEAQIIDVRTPEEYMKGNIEGSLNINFNSENFKETMNNFDKSKPVLIYCHSGGRSGKTLKMMKKMEFGTVLELEGGFSKWE